MKVDPDEVFQAGVPESERRETLGLLYEQVCESWRALIGVRFKLLGFVPSISGVAVAVLIDAQGVTPAAGAGLATFGLLATVGIYLYDQRNSQLHDELISRGRRIEYELGVVVGQFLGRPGSAGIVKHDYAVTLVYVATMAAWFAVGVVLAVG